MKILLVSTSSGSRGGGELFLVYLAQALADAGHVPALWCASDLRMDELARRFEPLGRVYRDAYPNSYHDRRLRLFSAAFDKTTIHRLADRLAGIPCDVIHLNKQTIEDGLDLLAAVRMTGRPLVSTIHITQTNRELGAFAGGLRDAFAIWWLRRAPEMTWTAVSDARREELCRNLTGDVRTVYNAVGEGDSECSEKVRGQLLEDHDWPLDALIVGCVARLVPQKDPSRFLRLAAGLHRVNRRARFLWIGDGDMREEFMREAAAAGLEEVLRCTGWLDEPQKLLPGIDLYLHPAAYEGLPLAILEAMAAGLPCILSPEIAAEMRVFDENTVILARDGTDDWMDLACELDARRHYSEASRRLYRDHFRMEAMAAAFVEIYKEKVK